MTENTNTEQFELTNRGKSNPTIEIFKKTLFGDIGTLPRLIGGILVLLFIPIILAFSIDTNGLTTNSSIMEGTFFLVFYLIYMPTLLIIISLNSAPLISAEVNQGTMLTLVSYPISRRNIFLSKFFASLIFGLIIISSSLSIICISIYLRFPFQDIFLFYIINLLNWTLVLFIFQSVTIGISCLVSKPRNALFIPLMILMVFFLIFPFMKMFLLVSSDGNPPYEQFYLYWVDIHYHFVNLLYSMLKGVLNLSPDLLQHVMTMGIAKYSGSVPVETNYVHPIISFIIVLTMGLCILFSGFLYFKNRDIQN
ncbi:MAG: ABC transporter permease [Candidatus Lokiarchaeota archaeon]|nr:ABC transporter permease [Candidatus Lokiarchaeota archaeon]